MEMVMIGLVSPVPAQAPTSTAGSTFTNDQLDLLAEIVLFLRQHRRDRLAMERPAQTRRALISVAI